MQEYVNMWELNLYYNPCLKESEGQLRYARSHSGNVIFTVSMESRLPESEFSCFSSSHMCW